MKIIRTIALTGALAVASIGVAAPAMAAPAYRAPGSALSRHAIAAEQGSGSGSGGGCQWNGVGYNDGDSVSKTVHHQNGSSEVHTYQCSGGTWVEVAS